MKRAMLWSIVGALACSGLASHLLAQPDVHLTNTTLSSGAFAYQATNSVTADTNVTINGSATVTFSAGGSIVLGPGFQATAGSAAATFTARIIPVVATPTFSPAGGPYGPAQTVTISTTTQGATIRYTTNFNIPSETNGFIGTSPTISDPGTTKLNAIAYGVSGYADSVVASATYTINGPVATPTLSLAGGTYSSTQSVEISSLTSGATLRYTTDGTLPTESNGTIYSTPVSVTSSMTIQAIAYESGWTDSPMVSASYTIVDGVGPPIMNPSGGVYSSAQTVAITSTTTGATIRYTTDGSTPTESNGMVYSGPVSLTSTTTLQAIAYQGETDSVISSALFTIGSSGPASPTREYIHFPGGPSGDQVIAVEVGHARQFATTSDQLNWGPLPNSPLRIVGDLSIGMWIKLPSNAQGCLICAGAGGSLNGNLAWPYFMSIAGSSGSWSIVVGHDTSYSNVNNASNPFPAAIPNDTWVYIGLSRDTTAQTYTLYESDGNSVTTVGVFAYSGNPPSTAGTASGSQVVISMSDYRTDLHLLHLVGTVEEHYVASRAWSSSEHLAAAQGSPPSGSLVLACRMGNVPEVDTSGSGLSGTVSGTVLVFGQD